MIQMCYSPPQAGKQQQDMIVQYYTANDRKIRRVNVFLSTVHRLQGSLQESCLGGRVRLVTGHQSWKIACDPRQLNAWPLSQTSKGAHQTQSKLPV